MKSRMVLPSLTSREGAQKFSRQWDVHKVDMTTAKFSKNHAGSLWKTTITMKNHHFQSVNPLFLRLFSIAMLLIARGKLNQ